MPGNIKPDQTRLTTLLTDTVILLCKNGLNYQNTLRIEGVLGITIDDSDVFIVHLNETVFSALPEAPDFPSMSVYNDSTEKVVQRVSDSGDMEEEKQTASLSPRIGKASARSGNKPSNSSRTTADGKRPVALIKNSVTARGSSPFESEADNEERSKICIKEESPDDCDVVLTEVVKKSLSFTQDEDDMMVVSKREWTREVGTVSLQGQTRESSEMFSRNEMHRESFGGMTGEWNLDTLALSSLASGAEVEAPPWQGYYWSGGSYGTEHLPGESNRVRSRNMQVAGNRSAVKMRMAHDRAGQPEMERHNSFAVLKPFACPVLGCNRRFYHRNNVYRHRKQKHGENGLGLISRRR